MFRNFLLFLLIVVAGCSTLPKDKKDKTRPMFKTHYGFEEEIRLHIDVIQKSYAPNCSYQIKEVRIIDIDSRSSKEEWVVRSCKEEVIYPVTIKPAEDGKIYFIVFTPKKFKKLSQEAVQKR